MEKIYENPRVRAPRGLYDMVFNILSLQYSQRDTFPNETLFPDERTNLRKGHGKGAPSGSVTVARPTIPTVPLGGRKSCMNGHCSLELLPIDESWIHF